MHRKEIEQTLTQRAGDNPDANAIADAALLTWREIATRLEPLLGQRGVNVLFGRALYLTSKTFPWLAIVANNGEQMESHAHFKKCLQTRDATSAASASYALLENFTQLLETLIGKSLTARLLVPVWAPATPLYNKEIAAHE
jgi:hypothetical protein